MDTEVIKPREFLRETIKLKVDTEAAFLELGARLYKIHNENLWEGEYDSYEDFILEARLSKATASKLEKVYETFVLIYKIPQKRLAAVGWSSLYTAAPYATSKVQAEELVERAGLLTRNDLARSLENENGKQSACTHEWVNYRMCTKCSERRRIYE